MITTFCVLDFKLRSKACVALLGAFGLAALEENNNNDDDEPNVPPTAIGRRTQDVDFDFPKSKMLHNRLYACQLVVILMWGAEVSSKEAISWPMTVWYNVFCWAKSIVWSTIIQVVKAHKTTINDSFVISLFYTSVLNLKSRFGLHIECVS